MKAFKKFLSAAVVASISVGASLTHADCKHGLSVNGVESIAYCDPKIAKCLAAGDALFEFSRAFGAQAKNNKTVVSNMFHASPWRAYGADLRILTVADIAEVTREFLGKEKQVTKVELLASWSGVRPAPDKPSIAEQLSRELKGFPVTGSEGFLWLNSKGEARVTRQAFTVQNGIDYQVARDGEVMVSGAIGWATHVYESMRAEKDAKGLLLAGVAWDAFGLCPEKALQAFEESAALGNPVAAYNAALMRIERATPQEMERASKLLAGAAKLGDARSAKELEKLRASKSAITVARNATVPDASAAPAKSRRSRAGENARECLRIEDDTKLRACAERFR